MLSGGYDYGKWHILLAVLAGLIMGPLDASIVYIAMPSIAGHFGVNPTIVGWVSMSYLLVLGSFLLAFGRLGDMFGFKRLNLLGLLVFTASSALCGLAPNLTALVILRGLQAVGAGLTMAMAPAIITAVFPANERGKALGITGMVVAVGLALGPSLGGILVDLADWRMVFYVNIPIGIAAYLWCLKVLPDAHASQRQAFDWLGAVLAFLGLFAMLLFSSRIQVAGWSWSFVLLGLAALTLLSSFIIIEKRVQEPMLDLKLFQNRIFSAGNGASLMNFMTQYVIVFVTPFFLQTLLGHSASMAGGIMTAFPLTVLFVAPLSGALSDKIGQRGLAFTGSLLCTVAALALASLDQHSGPLDVAWRLSVFGLGTGMFQSPITSAMMGAVPLSRLGIASGVLATTRNIGMVLGIALGGAVLSARQVAGPEFLYGFNYAYITAAAFSLAGTLVCLLARPAPVSSSINSPS